MTLKLYTKQPWKTLYLAYKFHAILLVLMPAWSITYMFTRPRPTWSWRHAMIVALLRQLTTLSVVIGNLHLPDYRVVGPDAEGIWIGGAPHLITAELNIWSAVAGVTSIDIPGYWYAKKGLDPRPTLPVGSDQRVFLFLHGGGFTLSSAHPKALTSNLPRSLVDLVDDAPYALAVEYRLSSSYPFTEEHPFPTALLDALAGYNHLVSIMGYSPSNIIVVGDSAGGNIALALTRYLVENKGTTKVPLPGPPGRLLLSSPSVDLSQSHLTSGSSVLIHDMDILGDAYGDLRRVPYGRSAYVGPFGFGMASCNRYVSPASLSPLMQAQFKGFPRTFIIAGGAERLLDPMRTLRDRMLRDMGQADVTYHEAEDAIHDYLIFSWHPSRAASLTSVRKWLA
ncbi:Alpha/Beta hydrolase protein [Pisolithus marmoratus]|nr:Alpha/Beta hydrolase protein [Pisolithus marmoratus]